jgi:DNA-binding Xre family transcriptional regulator
MKQKIKNTKEKKVPIRYLPKRLTNKDKKKQIKMLQKSRKLYKKGVFFNRSKLSSYNYKPSQHVKDAQKIYKIENITPNKTLSQKTGCSIKALKKIVNKGEGAYYSSGSRPNQTAQSWGLARLASSITAGKSAAVDFDILEKGCDHKKKAFLLAKKSKRKYKYGHSKTKKVIIK